MGSLTFVGLGLHDARDVSLRGLSVIQAADHVFLETYTSLLQGADKVAKEWGKPVVRLTRAQVEDGSMLLDAARAGSAVLCVVGDSMSATTHVELRVRAAKEGIATRLVPGASILTAAAGLLGLQSYKFGRVTTLAFPHGQYLAESPAEVIAQNRERGLHTLVLLDLDAEKGRYMSASEGTRVLLGIAKRRPELGLSADTLACAVARAGSDAPLVRAATLRELAQLDLGPPLHCLVVPGQLHDLEQEALRVLAGLPA
ncbi:MAG: diphthine synthase [Halobacteriales archaeon]|nr:diphthine synthase [Halobacteriales archaeon]